jgi:two-component system, OmpR family, sensor histidine kinase MtrB
MKGAATPNGDRGDVLAGTGAGTAVPAAAVPAAVGPAAVPAAAAAPAEVILRLPPRARRLAGAAWRAARAAQARCGAVLTGLRTRWSRSLQLRVVGTTLVFSATVITVLGFFLVQQIAAGLLQNKERSAATLAAGGLTLAESPTAFHTTSPANGAASGLMYQILRQLPEETDSGGTGAAVMINPARAQDADVLGWYQGPYVLAGAIPQRLINQVGAEQKLQQSQPRIEPTRLVRAGPGGHVVPGLAIGVPVGSDYQLYYLFPLTQEQQTLALVQRTIVVVGLALVFLLVAITSLVTRWVVVPVRQAAQGAQRLSTGNLTERMAVRGVDDLAALATAFNEMAASLQEKMQELQDLSHVQRQFVSDVSHELRTPLTTIRIAADVLFASRQQLDSASGRSAELLQSQLERFESLLVDLLEISRYDANAATLDPEPVDICDLVRNAADVAQQLAERRGAKIEFRLPAGPCVAEADRRRVERILRNLLVNAVEHGENRNTVVTVAGDRDTVAVAVRDYGVGLAPGQEHLVFDRFWRADPARARTTGGTGLGLSIALEDARLHGGWLEAWGERGRGSVFRLTLPRVTGAEVVGSPLPLVPDEAEFAAGAGAAGSAVTPAGGPVVPAGSAVVPARSAVAPPGSAVVPAGSVVAPAESVVAPAAGRRGGAR